MASPLESHGAGWLVVRLVLVAWLVTFFDGFDLNVIAFAAPYLVESYHLDTHALANVFTTGIAGTLLGAVLFGVLGDRIGRRSAIIAATALFGILTLTLAFAASYWELLLLRFVSGMALGGAIPLIWALSVEYAPRRYQATLVTVIMLGYGLGIAVAGPISLALIPRFGWQAVFFFGGIASLLTAVLLYRALPESPRFLAARAAGSAHFSSGPAVLFEGRLRWITPLLWLAYAASSLNTFFLATWGPLLFEGMGLSRHDAAWSSSMNSVAGALGALLLMRFTDRVGAICVALLPAVAVPFLLTIGFVPVSHTTFLCMMCVLYVFLGGSHYGVISVAGLYYPTTRRGLGTGWAAGIGKLGSMAGPWLGGWLMAANTPAPRTFAVLAIFPAVFCVCMLAIGLLERKPPHAA
ncbi:MAG: putative aromatic acid transporter [Gammaproteobacteria bacterium]|nr:putative aromatic acid transporter [Gammaproteobacteria bacterium]